MAAEAQPQLDKILILAPERAALDDSARFLAEDIPTAEVTTVETLDAFRSALVTTDFDIVVLDYDLPEVQSLEFLAQLRLRDYEPDVLLVSKCDSPTIARLIAESRKRYIVRDERWLDAMSLAVRDMLRIRRLETKMSEIRARLTEANSMLEERNRRLDEFCSTVAHDIRGPLAGIMLKLEYMMDAYEGEFDTRCTTLLQRCLDSSQRLTDIVQAMYEFAKIGSKAAKFCDISLKDLVYEVLSDLEVEQERDVKVGVGELPRVWANAALLRRVFINLVNNTIKYSDKEQIAINIGSTGIIERPIGRFVEIFVEDNGPGIPQDELDTIFSMFKRGSRGSNASKDGLGVGLAVVQRIIELHFGRISVTSNPGQGTRFTMLLPVEPVEVVN